VQIDTKLSIILEHFTDSLFDPDHLGIYKRALSQHVEMYLKVGGMRGLFCRCNMAIGHLLTAAAIHVVHRMSSTDLADKTCRTNLKAPVTRLQVIFRRCCLPT
jgi:hypothetical protein